MRALHLFLCAAVFLTFLSKGELSAQLCNSWYDTKPFSDSVSDNRNAFLAVLGAQYFVFWERTTPSMESEIVYTDYYNQEDPLTVVSGNNNAVSNPQVISTTGWWPYSDTLAYIFYQTDQSGNQDIYYTIMTDSSFTGPEPFAVSTQDESHLQVSQGGGMVWQDGEAIRFCRLSRDVSGFYFDPITTIDSGECRNPDLQHSAEYIPEEYIAWEKGDIQNPEIWYSQWGWGSGQWSFPMALFSDGNHSNPVFSKSVSWMQFPLFLTMDYTDNTGQHYFSVYDFSSQEELISQISQPSSFQPDLFSMDIPTQDFWAVGFLAFTHLEEEGNSDIFCNDYGEFIPWQDNYCRIDSTPQPDVHPQLSEGQWGGDCFDLLCIWESFRNGHWQLFGSQTLVIIGGIGEKDRHNEFNISVYPNPFNDHLKVRYSLTDPSTITFRLIDTYGRIIKSYDWKMKNKGLHEELISIPEIPAGTYLLKVEANGLLNSKVVIKR